VVLWASTTGSGASGQARVIVGDRAPVPAPGGSIELMTKGFLLMGLRSRFVSRAIVTALAVAVVGLVGLVMSPGAWADVTISPNKAVQGAGTRVTFSIPDGQGTVYTTKVEIQLPANAPIGEVDPMSVTGWAPTVQYRTVATPVQGLHGGPVTTIASAVLWSRGAAPAKGGGVNQLSLSMGPLPFVDRLPFTVVQTYSDGTVKRWSAPAAGKGGGLVLTLTPAAASGAAGATPGTTGAQGMEGMPGMEGMAGMGQVAQPTAAGVPVAGSSSPVSDNSSGLKALDLTLVLGVLVVGLIGGVWVVAARTRRRTVDSNDSEESAAKSDSSHSNANA
jgi:uncharacterized protein YcnI